MNILKQFSGQLNTGFLLANCLWGGIASGYMIYGWRQGMAIPLLGGVAMMAVSFLIVSVWMMSAASILIMFAVWWLVKRAS